MDRSLSDFGKDALVAISIACLPPVGVPTAWRIAQLVYENQCDPEKLLTAGQDWGRLADRIRDARENLSATVGSVSPEDWSAEDREAFEQHVRAYDLQLMSTQILASLVSGCLLAVGIALTILVLAYIAVSAILGGLALAILATMTNPYTLALSQSLRGIANQVAVGAHRTLATAAKGVEALSDGAAKLIGAAIAGNVVTQEATGSESALPNLLQATVDGADNWLAGFLSKTERDAAKNGIWQGGHHVNPNGWIQLGYGLVTQLGTGGVVDNSWDERDSNLWGERINA